MPLLEQVLEQYPTQIKLVFKNFPLRNHAQSRPAAIAALAAGEQGKFWELHDLLFQNFSALSEAKITKLAQQIGLDMERFTADRARPKFAAQINRDSQEGVRVGVRGTPSIFVDGRPLRQRSLPGFKGAIEAALARQH